MEQKDFAEKILEVKSKAYGHWENNRNQPPMDKAFQIAIKLNRKLEDIWWYEND